MASYLYRQTTVPTSEKKFTISTWMKISADTSVEKGIIEWYRSSSDRYQVLIDTTGKMRIHSQVGGSTGINIYTDMLFRDPASWYHIVIHNDTAESSATDRFKLWVNGEAQTFSTYSYTYNGSNINCFDGTSGDAVNVGVRDETSSKFFDGSLADTYYVDGSLIAYTQFGQTDSTSGIWKPNLSPTISSFGNAGFRLKYENSGNLGLDSSGNSLNMTASGTVTQNVDTPDNNFATWNPISTAVARSGGTFANGNTTITTVAAKYNGCPATLGMSSGKYYFEVKWSSGSDDESLIGIQSAQRESDIHELGHFATDYGYYSNNGNIRSNNAYQGSFGNTYSVNDIIGVAVDLDNNKLYFSKNGVWQNSGVPTSGSTGTGAFSITDPDSTPTGFYFPAISGWSNSHAHTFQANFGQGYFGTTQVASAGTAPSEGGIFEYNCPSGYQALCTKGINSF